MKEITVLKNKYKLIDFETEWTLKQQTLLKKVLGMIFGSQQIKDGEMDIGALFNNEFENRILALMYIEEKEELFNKKTYEKRCEAFESAILDKEMKEAIANFMSGKLTSIMEDTLIFVQGKAESEQSA